MTLTRPCAVTHTFAVEGPVSFEPLGAVLTEPIVSPRGEACGERKVPNPASVVIKNALVAFNVIWNALGMSPAARARLPR